MGENTEPIMWENARTVFEERVTISGALKIARLVKLGEEVNLK